MSSLNFGSTSIINLKQFSYVFLADCLLAMIAVVFIVFFLDRIIGFVLSQLVGWILWKKHRVYFSVSSVKFGLFGGRFFFKNLVYISENEAVSILHGSYTWRYWLKRVRRNRLKNPEEKQSLPARNLLRVTGVEWFIYNQSNAYVFDEDTPVTPSTSASSTQSTLAAKSDFTKGENAMFDMMPVTFEINTFSIIVGNKSTSTLMVSYSKTASVDIDVLAPSVSCDRYKLNYLIKANKPKIYFTANYDYDPEIAKTSKSRIAHWYSLQEIFANVKDHTRPRHHKGAALDITEDRHAVQFGDDTPIEHSKVSKFLDCDVLQIEYYYDVPDICHDKSMPDPEIGYKVSISNAAINYGPWTERRRVEFQELFLPPKCKNYTPYTQVIGEMRKWSRYVTEINFEGSATLRIPTREFSKSTEGVTLSNALSENVNDNVPGTAEVPYGWLELVIADGSNLRLLMDILPQSYGFQFVSEGNLHRAQIRTSVNHAELLSTDFYRFSLTQNTPLQWNGLQTWNFTNAIEGAKIFLLREHINLAIDLTEDLASGQSIPYELFIPALYNVDFNFDDIKLYTNVNPQNIISNPTSLTENVFLMFNASTLGLKIIAPFEQVAPVSNRITALAETQCLKMDILSPSWHTLDAFLDSKTVGIAHDFKLDYGITYYADVDYSRVEGHTIDIHARDFTLVTFGAVIDYLITIIDNYGGLDFKFQTPEEFASRVYNFPKYSNTREGVDVDYQITSCVENSCFVFPSHLYSAKDNLSLFTESWTADLRFTNYYMDLQTEFSPVKGYINRGLTPDEVLALHKSQGGINIIRTDELVARAHRMFGLPPSEPTYVCKWDFDIGDLALNIPADCIKIIPQVGQCFAHGLSNVENRPFFDIYKPIDVTFVTAAIDSISLKLSIGDDSINANTSAVTIKFNDLANPRFSDKIFVDIPSIHVFGFKGEQSILDFNTTLRTTIFTVKGDHQKHYEDQQEHIMLHDSLFHRCPFLLDEKHRSSSQYGAIRSEKPHVIPAMPMPSLPPQLTRETLLIIDSDMGQFDYKGIGGDSETGSEASLYGSGLNGSATSSSDFSSDDGSVIVKRRVKADTGEPENGKYLSLKDWSMPENDSKDVKGTPIFPVNWCPNDEALFRVAKNDAVNIVAELGSIDGSFHVYLHQVLQQLCEILDVVDAEAIMDQLECKLVDDMKKTISNNNLRAIAQIPSVVLRILNDDLIASDSSGESCIFAELSNIQILGDCAADLEVSNPKPTTKFTSSFERIIGGVRTQGSEATRIDLSRPALIYSEDKSGSNVEWRTGTLDFTTKADELEELAEFLKAFKTESPRPPVQKVKTDAASLIYSVLVAGQKAGIEHDPYVLSRTPAVQIANNIRGDVSWRIAMRLRYLLANIPSMEILDPPKDAKAQLLQILEHWRSWERIDPLDHARIFKEFEKSAALPVFPKIGVYVESLSTILKYNDTQEDYLVLDEFEIHGGLKRPSDCWTKCLFAISTQRARLGVTWDIIKIVEILDGIKPVSEPPVAPNDPPAAEALKSSDLIFQGIISLSVRDWSADLQCKSLKSEFQNKDVQLVSTIDYREGADTLFASGVFSSSQSAIRVHSPQMELELVDYLMEQVNIGFSTDTTHLKGPLWLSVDVNTLNLAINATFEELCQAAELVLKNEVAEASSLSRRMENSDQANETHAPVDTAATEKVANKSIELLINTNFMVSEFVFKVQAMNNFNCIFTGSDFALSGRMPQDNALLVNIEWREYVLRVMNGEDNCLGSFLVEGTKILARADLDAPAFDVKYNVDRVNLETTSILLVFRFMETPQVVEHVKNARAALENTIKTAQEITGHNVLFHELDDQVEKKNVDHPLFCNSSFSISQVRISLPVDKFSFLFIFDGIGAEHKTFDWTSVGVTASEKSFTYVSTSELSAQLIEGDSSTKVLSVQLLGKYYGVANLSDIYFTSEFCKVILSPNSVAAIYTAFQKVRRNVMHLFPEGERSEKKPSGNILNTIADIKAIIALHNFSVSWLTGKTGNDSEGIVGGFRLLQVNLANLQCRMDLVGLAVTPTNSPWISLAKNKYQNFAHLPHVEIIGVLLTKEKFIHVVINGESLHINLRPAFGILVSSIINSLDACQELLERDPVSVPAMASSSSPDDKGMGMEGDNGLMEYSLQLRTKFDAATFKLWDDNLPELPLDGTMEAPEPSLELNSPDMVTKIEYLHHEDARDLALVNVSILESSNQIYPKALQELKALFKYSTTAYDAQPVIQKPSPSVSSTTDTGKSFEALKSEVVSRFFKSIDLTVKVSLDEQRLSVSCQPFSKITTTISTNAIDILFTTPIKDDYVYLSLTGSISRAHLMLQHAHSHERSGFGGVDKLNLSLIHKISGDYHKERIMAGINIENPEFEIRAAQIRDIELFVDIWNPKKDVSMQAPTSSEDELEESVSIGRKYRQLLAEYPMSWTVNICVNNLICRADLGASLGQVTIVGQHAWASIYRAGNAQQFAAGLDELDVTSEGRLGAHAKLRNLSKRLTTYWEDVEMVPLVQLVLAIGDADVALGIDGHTFLASRFTGLDVGYANHLTKVKSGTQNLLVSVQLGDISIVLTSLVVSNIYDVIEPLNFLRAQTAIYQKTLARDGNNFSESTSQTVSNILANLRVRLAAQIDRVRLYVFPTNFEDTNALKVSANTTKFVFDRQQTVQNILPSQLELESHGYRIGLGTIKVGRGTQDLFERLRSSATSSMLVSIPDAFVSMDCTDIEGKRVEYIFKSMFGGDLEVGWNLGTLNFIRELYETHERTWLSRVAMKERTILEAGKRPRTIKEYMDEMRPKYVPIVPPEIQIPNLHDMGHATPPVEWMGFNRERLPGMTHWFVVRSLYHFIGDIERRYGAVLY